MCRVLSADQRIKIIAYLKPVADMIVREENGPENNHDDNQPVLLVEADQQPIDQPPVPNL